MLLKIFSPSLDFIGVADDYSSVRITRKFRDSPDITVRAKLSVNIKKLLAAGNFIMSEEADETFLIDYVSYDNDGTESRSAHVTVKARGILSMFSRRAVKYRLLHVGNAGVMMKTLVTNAASAMPCPIISDVSGVSKTVIYEQDYSDTSKALADICTIFSLGMSMKFVPDTKTFIFSASDEIDHTVNQALRPPVVYSRERENVIDEFYAADMSGYRNVAYVYGSEDGNGGRYNVTVGDAASSDRREIYIYARDLSVRRYEVIEDGVVTVNTSAYYAALRRRGEEELAKHPIKRTFSVTVNPTGGDYIPPLGSLCTLINRDWGIETDAAVTEDEWIVESGIFSRNITLTQKT